MVDWASKSYDELADFYWSDIAPERRKQGHNPREDPPSYKWLNEHGYSGLHRALKRDHDTTTRNFFDDILDPADEFDWPGNHERTNQLLNEFLESLDQRKGRAESTVESKRGRLSKILRTHVAVNGTGDLVSFAQTRGEGDDAFQQLLAVFDELDESLESEQSKRNHIYDLIEFYRFLIRRQIVGWNPAPLVQEEFDWDYSGLQNTSNPRLSKEQVKQIWEATRTLEEELLVICYIGIGLRTDEPAELTRDNFEVPDQGPPRIKFEDRKNLPDTVPVLVGKNQIAERLRQVQSNAEEADCLFPSSNSNRDALSGATMRSRFKDLCRRAGVIIDGDDPTPRHGRRTWYSLYVESLNALYEKIDLVAAEQGSKSSDVIRQSYLDSEIELDHHRQCIQPTLEEIMPGVNEYGTDVSFPGPDFGGQTSIDSFA